jgi:hypothetical protein
MIEVPTDFTEGPLSTRIFILESMKRKGHIKDWTFDGIRDGQVSMSITFSKPLKYISNVYVVGPEKEGDSG